MLEVAQGQAQLEDLDVDESVRQAYRAAQDVPCCAPVCSARRPAWGIQQSLNQADMLSVVNSALAGMLCVIAGAFPEETRATAFVVLLEEARHILSCQAKARDVTLECLIEQYFTALAVQEAHRPT